MFLIRLKTMVLAVALTLSCVHCSWAEDASPTQSEPSGGAVAAAVVSNLIYIPGKASTCALSGVLWTAAMCLTAGTIYKQAGEFVHGCCTGKWVIRGEDMAGTK